MTVPTVRPDFDSKNTASDLLWDLHVKADLLGGFVIISADDLRQLSEIEPETDPEE